MTFVAVMDPPWNADAGGGNRGAQTHYPLAGVDGIAQAVRMSGLWDDQSPALVWMWATSTAFVLGDAHALANRLRLRICAGFVWAKIDRVPGSDFAFTAPARSGLGQWSRCEHEHLLVCRRGDVPVPAPELRCRSVIYAPRGRHSEKPDEAWRVIEQTSRDVAGAPLEVLRARMGVEFFSRRARPGWLAWGHLEGVAVGAAVQDGGEP